ncbi:MAG: hypothetical protein AB7P69_14175 [Candidatus Binatia bacterium]
MAKVWFVRRRNRLIVLGEKPVHEGELESLIWPLDIGLHRYYTDKPPVVEDEPLPTEFSPDDMVLVEVTSDDVVAGTNYRVGFYSCPYSPKAVIQRLKLSL